MNRKKVLHINWSGSIGGAERALFQLVKAQKLLSDKYEPAVAFAKTGSYYDQLISELGCEVIDLGLENGSQILETLRIRKIFKRFPIHHFHSAEISLMIASFLCKGSERFYTQRGGITDYQGKQKLRMNIASHFLRHFDGLSGNTQHGAHSGAKLFSLTQKEWHVTYNGIDFELLKSEVDATEFKKKIGFLTNAPVIGVSAHLRPWKRIEKLLTACAAIKECNFNILIVGDGPSRNELQRTADAAGLGERTIFTGMVKNVSDYLKVIDVFVLPSTGLESFGNAIVEAMSQGIPGIVFSDSPGITEHIRDEKDGFIVSSEAELSQRLSFLISSSEIRKRMGENASKHVRSRYTYENMVCSYDKLYDSV